MHPMTLVFNDLYGGRYATPRAKNQKVLWVRVVPSSLSAVSLKLCLQVSRDALAC